MAEPQPDLSWRTHDFRQKIIGQIEEVWRTAKTAVPTNKSTGEIEEQFFQKTKSKEEYLLLVARFICHIKGINLPQTINAGTVTMLLNQTGIQDPSQALKTVINYIIQIGSHGGGSVVQAGVGGGMGGPGVVRPPFTPGSYSGGVNMNMPRRAATMPQLSGGGPMRSGDMFMLQQQQQQGRGGGMVAPPNVSMPPNNQQPMVGGGLIPQQQQQQQQQLYQYQMNSRQQQQQQQMGQGSVQQQFNMMNSMQQQPQQLTPVAGILMPGVQPGGSMVPSPASIIPSHSPSPSLQQQQLMAQSPASNAAARGGGLSPGSSGSMAGTPGNPSSIGVVGTNIRTGTSEEQEYLEKWKQLQKYIDPLKRMISKIDKDEERKSELVKMKNLLDILSDSNKRLPIETLNKCEHVLEKQLGLGFKPSGSLAGGSSSTGSPSVPSSGTGGSGPGSGGPSLGIFQTLFDTIVANVKNPNFNHTLQRTIAPVVRALHGPPLRVDSPPMKKRCLGGEDWFDDDLGEGDGYEIADCIQGEIGKLPTRFYVNLDPLHHPGSKSILLLCQLKGTGLPSLPDLVITLPDGYPSVSPVISSFPPAYDKIEYLRRLKEILLTEIDHLTSVYSLTALLTLWETCSRKAYIELQEAMQ